MRRLVVAWIVVLLLAGAAQCARVSDGPPDKAEVESQLHSILSQPEYNRVYGTSIMSDYMARASKAVDRALLWLARMLSPRFGERAGSLFTLILSLAAVGAFLFLVALLIRRLGAPRGRPHDGPAAETSWTDLPSHEPLARRARQLLAEGDFRGAFGCAYLASVARLDEEGLLRFDRSHTNWEYLRQIQEGGHQRVYDILRTLTEDFDRRFYGGASCSRQDVVQALEAYAAIAGAQA